MSHGEESKIMTDDVPGMDEKALHDLLDRHHIGDAEGCAAERLHTVVQAAYRRGWSDSQKSQIQGWQLQDLPLSGDALQSALNRLTPQERRMVELRWSLVAGARPRHATLDQLAQEFDLDSRERVCQLLNTAVSKMLDDRTA
jgi:hypothetical protein